MLKNKLNPVFVISTITMVIVVLCALIFPSEFDYIVNAVLTFLMNDFSWLYILSLSTFLFFLIWIGFFSPYRKRLLGDKQKPEYSNISWIAMLFSAGMGIGLVFWGAAEPLTHFFYPIECEPATQQAIQFAFEKSFLHWGLHPWATYGLLALAIGLVCFKDGRKVLISEIFIPMLGEKGARGAIGKCIDILAIFSTAAGVATSLGIGAMQISSGLNFVFNIPDNAYTWIVIVIVISFIFIWTAVTGVDKGIKTISDINIYLMMIALIAMIIIGPNGKMITNLHNGISKYASSFITDSFNIRALSGENATWYTNWTIFYWAWWIAWAPFTATFIARISRGRTIRQFTAGVLLIPTGMSIMWMTVFGTSAINVANKLGKSTTEFVSTAMFKMLNEYPFGIALSIIIIVLLITFFVTSANSATYVLGMFSSNGELNPPNYQKIVWGILISVLALVLMICSDNGLKMLQSLSIVAAFPFLIIMIFIMPTILISLKGNKK